MPAAAILTESWQRMPALSQLRDSVHAAGDTMVPGSLRWHAGPAGLLVWQSLVSSGRRGPLTLLWVSAASDAQLGGGRRPGAAWETAMGGVEGGGSVETVNELARIEAVRTWMRRADSALARGDLTAFARSWEALRGLLLDSLPQ
jgi:hypothetical protein